MIKLAIAFLFSMTLMSCSGGKTTTDSKGSKSSKEEIQERQKELQEMGFSKGVVVDYSKLDGCGYMIQLEDESKTLLWVPGLEDAYKVNGKEVWIKYNLSRMKSNCMKGVPAIIQEIKITD